MKEQLSDVGASSPDKMEQLRAVGNARLAAENLATFLDNLEGENLKDFQDQVSSEDRAIIIKKLGRQEIH